ncbi:MAG: IS6 family transposase [Fusobacteriaceae bacterium]
MRKDYFKYKQFQGEVILWTVRWYLKYSISSRELQEMMLERGFSICYSTIIRWVHQYAPILAYKVRKHIKLTNDSWRVDETYIKVKGVWKYLYRAVDSEGNTIDFLLTERRDKAVASKFFKKLLRSKHSSNPRVITIDKSGSNLAGINELKLKNPETIKNLEIRQTKYLNNIVEQDHRFIKKRVKPMLGFKSFSSAKKIISGIETMDIIRKEQVEGLIRNALFEVKFINELFDIYL